ncbi:hypothetical protein D3C78_1844210 [compost metagenome]
MFLCRPRKIGSAGGGGGATPDDFLAAQHRRAEHLIFEIAMIEAGIFGQRQHLAGFRHRARQGLLTGDRKDLAAA